MGWKEDSDLYLKKQQEWFESRSEEEKAALRAGALSWPDRKQQRWGDFHWRPAGPFDWTGCDDVVVRVGRLSGVPTVGESRFSADNLLALYEDGHSARELATTYLLDLGVVAAVLDFALSHGIPSNGTESIAHLREELALDPMGARLRTAVADWRGCSLVEIRADHLSGVPILKGTNVVADDVVEDFDDGASLQDIACRRHLGEDLIRAVLHYTGRYGGRAAA